MIEKVACSQQDQILTSFMLYVALTAVYVGATLFIFTFSNLCRRNIRGFQLAFKQCGQLETRCAVHCVIDIHLF